MHIRLYTVSKAIKLNPDCYVPFLQILLAEATLAIIFVGNVRYDPEIVMTATRESNCHEASASETVRKIAQRGCDSSSALVTALVNFANSRKESVFLVGDLVSQMAQNGTQDNYESLAQMLAT